MQPGALIAFPQKIWRRSKEVFSFRTLRIGGGECTLSLLANRNRCYPDGCGIVFKLAPGGSESVLHSFTGRGDGSHPEAGLVQDKEGNLYGTTAGGGAYGFGTVFGLAPDGTQTVLYAFGKNQHRGREPQAGLMRGDDGQLYGTTSEGGDEARCHFGCGTVFRISK